MFKTLNVKEGDRENESDEPQRLIKDLHPADSEAKVKVDASLVSVPTATPTIVWFGRTH